MLPTALVAIGYLVVAASAYDFSDESFNRYLSSQLTDWTDLDRARRSTEDSKAGDDDSDDSSEENKNSTCRPHPPPPPKHGPPPVHWKSCCGNGKWMRGFGGKDRETMTKCMDEIKDSINTTEIKDSMDSFDDMFSCAKVNMRKMRAVCMSECTGKKAGLLTEEGHLKSQNLRSYVVNDFFQEDWSRSIAEGVIDKCIHTTNATSSKMSNGAKGADMKCNPEMLSFVHCLWQNIEKNCPEFQRKQDPKCKEYFQRLDSSKKSGS